MMDDALPSFLTGHAALWTQGDPVALFLAALTRRAWLQESGAPGEHHESLEWLGDRILNALVAQELWRRFPFAEPGRIDLLRAALCGEPLLADIGRAVGLTRWIRMGHGERLQRQVETDAALSDHVEAVLGAAFLAGGWQGAAAVMSGFFEGRWPQVLPDPASPEQAAVLDPMSELNQLVQQIWRESLRSDEAWATWSNGPPHALTWTAAVTLPDGMRFEGEPIPGKAKKAKASAAVQAVLLSLIHI